ncbi:MAG: ParA family partition ATPase [Geminicoccaceae bacterium]
MAVISITQQKGGAGKTTLAVQLGVAWLVSGRRVAMLDVDPQASLSTWFNLRRRRLGDDAGGLVVHGLSGWRLGSELRRLRDAFDHILVDSPPHAEIELKTAIREADLALLPCQPSALDVWATKPTLEYAKSERTAALLVLNRVPPRGRAAAMIRADIEAAGWPLAATSLGNRQAFAASIGEGRGVAETAPASPAGHEIAALAKEVLGRLG